MLLPERYRLCLLYRPALRASARPLASPDERKAGEKVWRCLSAYEAVGRVRESCLGRYCWTMGWACRRARRPRALLRWMQRQCRHHRSQRQIRRRAPAEVSQLAAKENRGRSVGRRNRWRMMRRHTDGDVFNIGVRSQKGESHYCRLCSVCITENEEFCYVL